MDIDPDAVPDVLLLLSEAEACLTSDVARSGVLARQALALVEATGRPLLLARALCTAAAPLLFEKDLPGAQQLYQRAVVQSQLMHDTSTLSRALNGLGLCALRQGAYAQALAFFLDGLRQTPPEDAFGRLRLLNNIGLTRMEVGDHAFALQVHEQVVALAEELGEEISVLTGLTNIIVDRYELGEYTRVLTLIEQAQPDIMRSGLVAHRVVLAIYATLCSLQLGELAQAQAAATRLLP
ncbi:tetratricopeptide repeat protein (plasmid) [Deinococcus sp. KNUC1210]|uniref:tetratricopeptide repeat protein n=1 Tax=Deinococcus sp. KNUC1210 TaxID=2917691 RepID=UPI001EF12301|nr:tetratricopeptide repeat protein [Deinococcus sp. KNUC1210]ULH18030.1 tetratricopeptide repeat protein [Deinococcus sp. KNUC1210]